MFSTLSITSVSSDLSHFPFLILERESGVGLWAFNWTTGQFDLSDNVFCLCGLSPAIGLAGFKSKVVERIHPDDRQRVVEFHQAAAAVEGMSTTEFSMVHPDGRQTYLRSKVAVSKSKDGSVFMAGFLQDITPEQELRRQLKDRELVFEQLADAARSRILVLDSDLNIVFWNRKCEEFFGISRKDILWKKIFDMFPQVAQSDYAEGAYRDALSGKKVILEGKRGMFKEQMLDIALLPRYNWEGKVTGVVALAYDVTDQVASRELLERKNRELERANTDLAAFAYVASHDLKEPLRKVQAFSERIQEKESERLSDTGKDHFRRIMSAVERMDSLIEDMLVFSRLNTVQGAFGLVDMQELLQTVIQDFEKDIREVGAHIEVLSLSQVWGQSAQLHQLMHNLVSNALKFQSPDRPPEIRIRTERLEAENGKGGVMLEVSDNGIGFDQEFEEKIFQMFQRLHPRHLYPGTGIGLTICRKVMSNHNGWIQASGKPGEGAVFQCYFPDMPFLP